MTRIFLNKPYYSWFEISVPVSANDFNINIIVIRRQYWQFRLNQLSPDIDIHYRVNIVLNTSKFDMILPICIEIGRYLKPLIYMYLWLASRYKHGKCHIFSLLIQSVCILRCDKTKSYPHKSTNIVCHTYPTCALRLSDKSKERVDNKDAVFPWKLNLVQDISSKIDL